MSAIKLSFNQEKALETIVYISQSVHDLYHLLKIIYFADRKHLERYGRFIFGDEYVAMAKGPVPSGAYDIIKYVKGENRFIQLPVAKDSIEINHNDVTPRRQANIDFFSVSDLKCLDESIKENGYLSFGSLKNKSHDSAYESADQNDFISIESIAATMQDGDSIIEYLKN